MGDKKETIIEKVVTAAVVAWTDVGKAFLGSCGGQEDIQTTTQDELPKARQQP